MSAVAIGRKMDDGVKIMVPETQDSDCIATFFLKRRPVSFVLLRGSSSTRKPSA